MSFDITKFIDIHMTVLDTISRHPETEHVFKQYDQKVGECVCCNALFDSLENMAKRYKLDLNELLTKLGKAIHQNSE